VKYVRRFPRCRGGKLHCLRTTYPNCRPYTTEIRSLIDFSSRSIGGNTFNASSSKSTPVAPYTRGDFNNSHHYHTGATSTKPDGAHGFARCQALRRLKFTLHIPYLFLMEIPGMGERLTNKNQVSALDGDP
jgi:hypothetical protein